MNSPLIHNTADQDNFEPTSSPGRRLRIARQSKGFEIAGIASQLHLHPDKVEALEQDRYSDLAGSVFVSGYIRNYARLMGLDPEPLLVAYQAADPNAVEVPKRVITTPTEPQREARSNDLVVRLVSLIIILAIVGLFATWWMSRSEPLLDPGLVDEPPMLNEPAGPMTEPIADEPVTEPQPDDTRVPALPSTTGDNAALEIHEPAVSPAPDPGLLDPAMAEAMNTAPPAPEAEPAVEPELELEPAAASGMATIMEPAAAASASVDGETADASSTSTTTTTTAGVVLEFTGPCWVDVRDSSRTFKVFGEQGNGDRFVLEGTPPYDIVLGNTSAVRIMINDEPFDLESRSKGNVARFQLDPNDAL